MNHNKYIIKAAFCLSFLLFSSSSFPMLTPFHQHKKAQQERIKAQQHEAKLKKIKSIKTISEVDAAIKNMKNHVYKECLTELASLTNQPYNDLLQTMTYQEMLTTKALQKKDLTTIQNHDGDIPLSIYNSTIKIMLKYKINPNGINLEYMMSPNDEPGLQASANGGFLKLNTDMYLINPRIRFYSRLSEQPENMQIFTIHHELAHLYLNHTFMDLIALSSSHKNNITLSSSQRKKLHSIQEREADINAASKNIHIAHTGMQQRCTFGHVEIIDNKSHCYDMQIMYALMKQKEKLATLES